MKLFSRVVVSVFFVAALFVAHSAHAVEANVRVSPVGLLIGLINAEVDFQISEAWTLGPSVAYWSLSSGNNSLSVTSLGVRANYYLNGQAFTDGWYFSPKVASGRLKIEEDDLLYGKLSGEVNYTALVALAGYHWFWEAFNLNLGAGFSMASIGDLEVTNSDGSYVEKKSTTAVSGFALDFTVGWVF